MLITDVWKLLTRYVILSNFFLVNNVDRFDSSHNVTTSCTCFKSYYEVNGLIISKLFTHRKPLPSRQQE